jgi:hypothetical protein
MKLIYLLCVMKKVLIAGTVDKAVKDAVLKIEKKHKKRNFSDALEFVINEGILKINHNGQN